MFYLRRAIEDMNALGKEFIYKGICYAIEGSEITAHVPEQFREKIVNAEVLEGTTRIGSYGFFNCCSLQSIHLPTSLRYIQFLAFEQCSSLSQVVIPENVIYIANYAFAFCTHLKCVIICDGVQEIGTQVFAYCPILAELVLPPSITTIGKNAFSNIGWCVTVKVKKGSYAYKRCKGYRHLSVEVI